MNDKPAILGGKPIFEKLLPIARPSLPKLEEINSQLQDTFTSGILTNGKYVAEFEQKCSQYLGVENVIAVSSATAGLILVEKALGLNGEVLVPSFTFTATCLSLNWNKIETRYVDCHPKTFTLDPILVEKAITRQASAANTCAILAVCIFGNPPDMDMLNNLAKDYRLKLIFDSAHGFGTKYNDKLIGGFGDAEVFSLTPTKSLTTGEGGLITTNDKELAQKLKLMRNYGVESDYDCELIGLNARMLEFSAILGLKNLSTIEEKINHRNKLAKDYKTKLSKLPGIEFQEIKESCRSTFKDFAILINEEAFGLNRDELGLALEKENIQTRKYFYPPVHLQKAYRHFYPKYGGDTPPTPSQEGIIKEKLSNTLRISSNILCLPISGEMNEEELEKVCAAIEQIHQFSDEIRL
ncbi:MAG: DegT/DnrJ/EryC1/StrS family aminotransferase [Nitrospirota bacterium]